MHPEETAMLSIGVNANNRPIEPTIAPPDFGIKKNLNPVADLDFLSHISSSAAVCPENGAQPDDDHDPTIDRPLRIAGHVTAGQDVDSLEEEYPASQDEDDADDVEKCFHFL